MFESTRTRRSDGTLPLWAPSEGPALGMTSYGASFSLTRGKSLTFGESLQDQLVEAFAVQVFKITLTKLESSIHSAMSKSKQISAVQVQMPHTLKAPLLQPFKYRLPQLHKAAVEEALEILAEDSSQFISLFLPFWELGVRQTLACPCSAGAPLCHCHVHTRHKCILSRDRSSGILLSVRGWIASG